MVKVAAKAARRVFALESADGRTICLALNENALFKSRQLTGSLCIHLNEVLRMRLYRLLKRR